MFDLTSHFHRGSHDAYSCRKVLPLGECLRCVRPAHI